MDEGQLSSDEQIRTMAQDYLKELTMGSIARNSRNKTTKSTGYDSTDHNSDTASSSLHKKKKKLTKFREKEMHVSDGSSDFELPQQITRQKRKKKSGIAVGDDALSDDSLETPGTLQEMQNSFHSTQEYIDNLLSYLKYNIKYVTNEALKKELREKMLSLEMQHKRNLKDLDERKSSIN